MKKIALVIAALLLAAVLYIKFANPPQQLPEGSVSAKLLQNGPQSFVFEDVTFEDKSRKTDATGDYKGASSRSLVTRIWYPKGEAKPGPLLIYSHGFMSSREGGSYIAEHLASHGWVVAAPDFPLTNYDAPGPQVAEDVVNQPEDVSFVIDNVLARAASQNDVLYGRIDAERIAKAGMSLGGMTTALAAYHPVTGDERIDVAVSIAGPTFTFARKFFEHRDIPFLMIASPIDAMVEYTSNAADIPEKIDGAVLVTLENASHAGFSFQSRALGFMSNADQIGCWAISGKVDTEANDRWFTALGTPEQGIIYDVDAKLCEMDPLPPALHPLYQQQINQLVVSSFLRCHLQQEPSQCDYLMQTISKEVEGLSVRKS